VALMFGGQDKAMIDAAIAVSGCGRRPARHFR